MLIIAGTLLVCMVKIEAPGTYGSFVKDVPTKVLYVDHSTNDALVEYDFAKAPGIDVLEKEPQRELVNLEDLRSSRYGRCRYADEKTNN